MFFLLMTYFTSVTLPPPESYTAYKAERPIVVDGDLSEWENVPYVEVNYDIEKMKRVDNIKTFARVLWDKENLYISFQCKDDEPWATITKRDGFLWEEEAVEVFIDPKGDGARYVELGVNPLNAVDDILIIRKPKYRWLLNWNLFDLKTAVKKKKDGWDVEIAIPWWNFLSFEVPLPPVEQTWRIQLCRVERPDHKTPIWLSWSPTYQTFHKPETFGKVFFSSRQDAHP
ncbi:carbohydrate-binding family 9-like protein [bacterium]|nr:carbohydrate-binding family 9-like protein [bacterium]